ncbi:hypothetical protein ElyMa_005031700 [Elysia marginata]|uniref:Uncharacterized protein n=1 Tax=Elysia marginata TaxID=1093978 RepID=A0AAV4JDF0_9GAST|nr:hypothetical protein ElyMa_005031700 [Elysia marginata]
MGVPTVSFLESTKRSDFQHRPQLHVTHTTSFTCISSAESSRSLEQTKPSRDTSQQSLICYQQNPLRTRLNSHRFAIIKTFSGHVSTVTGLLSTKPAGDTSQQSQVCYQQNPLGTRLNGHRFAINKILSGHISTVTGLLSTKPSRDTSLWSQVCCQ